MKEIPYQRSSISFKIPPPPPRITLLSPTLVRPSPLTVNYVQQSHQRYFSPIVRIDNPKIVIQKPPPVLSDQPIKQTQPFITLNNTKNVISSPNIDELDKNIEAAKSDKMNAVE